MLGGFFPPLWELAFCEAHCKRVREFRREPLVKSVTSRCLVDPLGYLVFLVEGA